MSADRPTGGQSDSPENKGLKPDRAATEEEVAFAKGVLMREGFAAMNANLGARWEATKKLHEHENEMVGLMGEIWRLEHLLGKDEDAGILDKIAGRISGGKEDNERLAQARKDLEFLEAKRLKLREEYLRLHPDKGAEDTGRFDINSQIKRP